jgi:DASH complex subunit DAM1
MTTPTASNHFSDQAVPLEALEPAFGELADGMADLEANMMHLQLLHESLNRFNECFGAFLYGMNMSAFCVDFPEAPGIESFKRAAEAAKNQAQQDHAMSADVHHRERDVDATFLYIIPTLSHHASKTNLRFTVLPTPVSSRTHPHPEQVARTDPPWPLPRLTRQELLAVPALYPEAGVYPLLAAQELVVLQVPQEAQP